MIDHFVRYLNFLSSQNTTSEIFTGYVGTLEGTGVVEGWGVVHGDLLYWEGIARGIEGKACVHICLNRTKLGGGRGKGDIVEPRVLCVDIDAPISDEELDTFIQTYAPHMIVESSPGKTHFYWMVARGWRLVDWVKISAGLGALMGGDMGMCQVNKTIRAPGLPRISKDGVACTPMIIHEDMGAALLSYGEWVKSYPGIVGRGEEKLAELREARRKIRKGVKGEGKRDAVKRVGRNEALFSYIYGWCLEQFKTRDITFDDAVIEAMAWVEELGPEASEGKPPFTDDEVEKTVLSAYDRASEREEETRAKVAAQVSSSVTVAAPTEEGEVKAKAGDSVAWSDSALIEILVKEYRHRLLRIDGDLLVYHEDKHIWVRQKSGSAHLLGGMCLQTTLRIIASEEWVGDIVRGLGKNDDVETEVKRERKAMLSFAKQRSFVDGVINSDLVKEVSSDAFDSARDELGCVGGIVKMSTGEAFLVEPKDMLLNNTNVVWDPNADMGRWQQFVSEICEGDVSKIDFLQTLFGYSISGYIGEERIFFHMGVGSNGKSKLMGALSMICGSYGTVLSPDEFVMNGARFERVGAHIEGRRVAIVEDMNTENPIEESFIKNVTGKRIVARAEYEKSRNTRNRCVIHCCVNDFPVSLMEDPSLRRRVCVLTYTAKFESDADMSIAIDRMIEEDASGILRWAVEGYQKWTAAGKLNYGSIDDPIRDMLTQGTKTIDMFLTELYRVDHENGGIDTDDILEEVKRAMRGSGMRKELAPNKLGMILRTLFKVNPKRGRKYGVRARFWPLVRN
jgi:P4 family phage/plasmid primase-like protien